MADSSRQDERDLPAGAFAAWLTEVQSAIRGERASEVPCDGCTACCTSSQFVHIEPDETDTLSHLPAELLFPAPQRPPGHVVLGYDEHGRCPMLVEDGCSVYEHRPRACRTYDCRIFPAAAVEPEADQTLIAQRARRWEFSFPTPADRNQHAAVRAAATFLREYPSNAAAPSATQVAVLAVELHETFLRRTDETG